MKVIYSEIKKLVPGLSAKPREIGEVLTMTGLMLDGFEQIKYGKKTDWLLSFEVRQNRADCFSVIGIAREIAACYGLNLKLSKPARVSVKMRKPDIKVAGQPHDIKRILAVEIDGVKNGESPLWLKDFLNVYGMNSKNLLVDLSNYVMIYTGYPSHLLDLEKVKGGIVWTRAQALEKITTLDGSVVVLPKDDGLAIKDGEKILALAGIVGGREAEISFKTTKLFAEMAVYNPAVIRKNSRDLKIVTEASSRLEKDLDPDGAGQAFDLLASLILKYAKGKISSGIYEYYPIRPKDKKIVFDANSPAVYSGIAIASSAAEKILKNLGFFVKKKNKQKWQVFVPTFRTDISLPQDLVEEVVRIYGYQKIPSDIAPATAVCQDITPRRIKLAAKMKEILSSNGFDEILSLPLTEINENAKANWRGWETIVAENAINELYPELRLSLATGLIKQAQEFHKKNIVFIDIFENGKIFGKKDGKYLEQESLGVLSISDKKALAAFKDRIETMVRSLGFREMDYVEPLKKPEICNPSCCWTLNIQGSECGIIYKLKRGALGENVFIGGRQNAYFAEIDINMLEKIKIKAGNPVSELNDKLVILDMNVEIKSGGKIEDVIGKIEAGVGEKNLWSIAVIDKFLANNVCKYTIRVTYDGLTDPEAKKIHGEILNRMHLNK